jgi:signal transduction histidine kinase
VVTDVDETIRQIRTTIFQLRGQLGPQTGTARSRVLAVVAEVSLLLKFEPRVDLSGPIDSVVPDAVVDDVVAVIREALTNVARHARATRADVLMTASTNRLSLDVVDDGVGLGEATRRSGLGNLRARAEQYGGSFVITPAELPDALPTREGTRVRWTIPLT